MFRTSLGPWLVLVACTACVQDDELAITGTYMSEFGATQTITETEWTVDYGSPDTYAITVFDNDERFVVAENGAMNSYNAGLWSRFDWALDGDDLFYCQTVFDGMSEDEALDAQPADTSDPATGGCGAKDFPFTMLSTVVR